MEVRCTIHKASRSYLVSRRRLAVGRLDYRFCCIGEPFSQEGNAIELSEIGDNSCGFKVHGGRFKGPFPGQ